MTIDTMLILRWLRTLSAKQIESQVAGLVIHSFISFHSFIQTISIALLQVHYYPEALPTQHIYCIVVSRRSATGNCELRTWCRLKRIRTHDLTVERHRLNQCATTSHGPLALIFVKLSHKPLQLRPTANLFCVNNNLEPRRS